jgi:YD repeat-containing protein
MTKLRIRHETVYSYTAPVGLGSWRLLFRPQDTHAMRLIDASIEAPAGDMRWSYDAYGNSVCQLTPYAEADRLVVVNNLLVERYPTSLLHPGPNPVSTATPITYDPADRMILEPFIIPATGDSDPAYMDWLKHHLPEPGVPAADYLGWLNRSIQTEFQYGARDAYGTQSPGETLAAGAGTCRDFAWLMIESVRRLGFAARFATGYLHSPGAEAKGGGATHAWCEVFIPGQGWLEFDPTNALVESTSLIRIATTRTWEEASPMSGGPGPEASGALAVTVDVEAVDEAEPLAQVA